MSYRKRRKYTPEFKAEVVELVRQADKSLSQICRDMDLTPSAVKNWVDKVDQQTQQVSKTRLSDLEVQELKRLRRENQQLRMEREILVKAAAFFAKEST